MKTFSILCMVGAILGSLCVTHLYHTWDHSESSLELGVRNQRLEESIIGSVDDYFNKLYDRVERYSTNLDEHIYTETKRVNYLEARIDRLEKLLGEQSQGLVINNQNTLSGSNK